ncbi:MAG: hypothetical protein R6U56_09775, partial [Opitutales bacterium]
DISGGQPALIIQMLVGSEVGEIRLLPALPEQWPEGSIEGVLCRGAIEIERLEWTPGQVDVTLVSKEKQTVNLSVGDSLKTVSLPAGRAVSFSLER